MSDDTGSTHFAAHLRADGRDEVAATLFELFPEVGVRIGAPLLDGPMLLRHDVFGDHRFTYQRMDLTGRVQNSGHLDGLQMIGVVRHGGVEVGSGRSQPDTARPFLYPEGEFTGTAEQYGIDLLTVRTVDLDRAARVLGSTSTGRVRFTGSGPVGPAAERFWRSTQAHVAAVLTDPALLASPLLRAEAFRATVRAVLLTFPNTALAAPAVTSHRAASPAVDAATSYIETNAHRPIDLADIAAAAGTTAPALTRAFRDRHGHTPLQHLRTVRMQRARADLAAADAWGTTTVRDVAARWGFRQPGRFAEEYRRRFGESPSTTLRR